MNKSSFLNEVFTRAMKYGKKNSVLTAEKFIVGLYEAINDTYNSEKEIVESLTIFQMYKIDENAAKSTLIEYIEASKENTLNDSLYMQKKTFQANAEAEKKGMNELTASILLCCILTDPSDTIKKIINKNNDSSSEMSADKSSKSPDEMTFKEIAEEIEDLFKSIDDTIDDLEDEELPKEEEELDPPISKKEEMATLVEEVKRIRKELSKDIFGQDNAINVVATGYFQAGMLSMIDKTRKRPKATFLFAGPPGVGKTFMAEKIAEALGDLPFQRYDMSEYADKEAAIEFCGSDGVYKNSKGGNVTEFISKNPKCVLLFDEIEKAHISIIHLFLQILDAGRIRDNNSDKEISLSDVIIIMTTNAGHQAYEDVEGTDLSMLSRKVIINALEKDIDPKTGNPFFPAAICSRFASGNVVMFNHIGANNLRVIAKKEINRHADSLKRETGIELQIDEKVYTALLFSEGASVDARTIRSRAESFFNDELYELFRLISSEKVQSNINNIEKIHIAVDLSQADNDIMALFDVTDVPKIMVFADDIAIKLCKEKLPSFEVVGVKKVEEAIKTLKDNDFGFVLIDIKCGATEKSLTKLNIEDVESSARDFLKFIKENRNDLPVYLIEGDKTPFEEEEKISFIKQGVRGTIRLSKDEDSFETDITEIFTVLHQQDCMVKLARANKLVSFNTSQTISKNGKNAEIKLFDFEMKVAIDSEDSKNVLSSISKPNVKFDDVIGAKDAKKELEYFVEYLKNPKKYAGSGVKAPKGVLLYGPPGTGKTMLAKAMAKESDVTFIVAEGNQFLKQYVGEGPKQVHELFKTARKYAPSILFIDEVDAIAKERRGAASGNGGVEETLTAFLAEMDGFANNTSKPVFVLAATNFDVEPGGAKSLDPALMRRFDRRVYIELPDRDDRIKFMNLKIAKNEAFDITNEQIDNISMRSTGMSLAELDSAMELALRSAIREGSTKVTDAILEEAFETFNNGETKKWDASQLERVARHEAGHAFMCWYNGETPSYLTIVARGNHGGYMQHADNEGKAIYTKDELLAKIKTSLGGRAAEIAYYGEKGGISTGASGDLISATNIARQILCTYGMDDNFGLAVVSSDVASNGNMSIEVRGAVNRILKEQMNETVEIISENKDKIDSLVDELMMKNHLSGAEIEKAIKKESEIDISKISSAK